MYVHSFCDVFYKSLCSYVLRFSFYSLCITYFPGRWKNGPVVVVEWSACSSSITENVFQRLRSSGKISEHLMRTCAHLVLLLPTRNAFVGASENGLIGVANSWLRGRGGLVEWFDIEPYSHFSAKWANFRGLVLSCIDAKFSNKIFVGKLLTRSTRFACFCTAQTSIFQKIFIKLWAKFNDFVFENEEI